MLTGFCENKIAIITAVEIFFSNIRVKVYADSH